MPSAVHRSLPRAFPDPRRRADAEKLTSWLEWLLHPDEHDHDRHPSTQRRQGGGTGPAVHDGTTADKNGSILHQP